jgi:hypothetical protein
MQTPINAENVNVGSEDEELLVAQGTCENLDIGRAEHFRRTADVRYHTARRLAAPPSSAALGIGMMDG